MLSESVLGPVWAFLFVSERPSMFGLIGGAIILLAVLLQFYSLLTNSKKSVSHWHSKFFVRLSIYGRDYRLS